MKSVIAVTFQPCLTMVSSTKTSIDLTIVSRNPCNFSLTRSKVYNACKSLYSTRSYLLRILLLINPSKPVYADVWSIMTISGFNWAIFLVVLRRRKIMVIENAGRNRFAQSFQINLGRWILWPLIPAHRTRFSPVSCESIFLMKRVYEGGNVTKWMSYLFESLFMISKILRSPPNLGGKYSAITTILFLTKIPHPQYLDQHKTKPAGSLSFWPHLHTCMYFIAFSDRFLYPTVIRSIDRSSWSNFFAHRPAFVKKQFSNYCF